MFKYCAVVFVAFGMTQESWSLLATAGVFAILAIDETIRWRK